MSNSPHDHAPRNSLKAKVANLSARLVPTCREVARLTSEKRDHPLPLGARLRLGFHSLFCAMCVRYDRQLDVLNEASHRFPDHIDQIVGQSLENEVKARMKSALQNQENNESRQLTE